MQVTITKFKAHCLELIDEVHQTHQDIVITRKGKPLAKLSYLPDVKADDYVGSLTGVGKTMADLTEPIAEVWEASS